jgi:hypothetical protein
MVTETGPQRALDALRPFVAIAERAFGADRLMFGAPTGRRCARHLRRQRGELVRPDGVIGHREAHHSADS